MTKEILWVQVGQTDSIMGDKELERVRDVLEEEFETDDKHCVVVGEDIELFDLDELKRHVSKIEELLES